MTIITEIISNRYEQVQEFQKKYEAEITLGVKLVMSTTSLLAINIFKMPSAKSAKEFLTLAKAIFLLPSNVSSFGALLKREFNSVNDLVRHLSSATLGPFTLITLAGSENSKFIDSFFEASPVFSHLKFAGIPNIAIIGLLASFAFDAYAKQNELEKANSEPIGLGNHRVKIIQNHWGLVEKTAKVASTVFSFVVLVGSYSHPAITAVKVTFLVVEMGLAVKKYQTKFLSAEYSVEIAPQLNPYMQEQVA